MATNDEIRLIHEHTDCHDWKYFNRALALDRPDTAKYRYCVCGRLEFESGFTPNEWQLSNYVDVRYADLTARQAEEYDGIIRGAKLAGLTITLDS